MSLRDLVLKTRSYRRFHQDVPIKKEALKRLVDFGRLSASAANLQPLKYILSNDPSTNAKIFEHLAWAGYLPDWPGPIEGERPPAYIIVLGDTTISKSFDCDLGIAVQNMLLGATENDMGGCMIGSINRPALKKALKIPKQYKILLVLAIGKAKEKITIDPVGPEGSIKYWRDTNEMHHVPKRSLKDVIVEI